MNTAVEPIASAADPGARTADVTRATALVVWSLVAVGAVLRFSALGHQSFWYDESVSAQLAQAPLADIVTGRVRDLGNPPFHLILLHVWGVLFGTGDASLRAMSAAASVASIPLMFAVTRRLATRRVALVCTALLAISPVHVYYAQEARTYTLVTLLCLTQTLLLLHAVRSPRRISLWAAYAFTTFLAMYSHYFAAFVVFAHMLWVLRGLRGRRGIVVPHLASLLGAGLLYLVWLPSLIAQATTKGNLGRAADTWHLHLFSTPLVFGVGTTLLWKDTITPLRVGAGMVAFAAFTVSAVAGVWAMRRDKENLTLVLTWLVVPVLLPLAISVLLFPFFSVRYALVASPAYYILVAAGLCHLARTPRIVAGTALAGTSALSLVFYFTTQVKHDWRDAAAWIKEQAEPGDVMVFDADIGETAFARYAGADGSRLRLLARKQDHPGKPDKLDKPDKADDALFFGTSATKEPPHAVDDAILAAPRLWYVFSDPKDGSGDHYKTIFEKRWHQASERDFRGIEVHLYDGHGDTVAR